MEFIVYVICLILAGSIGGFLSGLLGVGGGIVLTPIQYYLLEINGTDPQIAMTVAVATSIAVIAVSISNSTRHHYKNGFVEKTNLKIFAIMGFIGSIFGALLSVNLDVTYLKIIFGLFCIISAVLMFVIKNPEKSSVIDKSVYKYFIIGFFAGVLSGLLGLGGGALLVPCLSIILKYPTHKAIGTSSFSMIFITTGGILSYILLGLNQPNLPMYCLGYVNLLQFVIIVIFSTLAAGFAAGISKSLNPYKLKVLQLVVFTIIGLKMMGVFDFLIF